MNLPLIFYIDFFNILSWMKIKTPIYVVSKIPPVPPPHQSNLHVKHLLCLPHPPPLLYFPLHGPFYPLCISSMSTFTKVGEQWPSLGFEEGGHVLKSNPPSFPLHNLFFIPIVCNASFKFLYLMSSSFAIWQLLHNFTHPFNYIVLSKLSLRASSNIVMSIVHSPFPSELKIRLVPSISLSNIMHNHLSILDIFICFVLKYLNAFSFFHLLCLILGLRV